jgi:glycosyltransferase involved in cell wall biosynthesis
MAQGDRPSICYIVPAYTPDDASHMAHLPRFLSEVGKACDVHVIIQRGSGQLVFPNVRSIYVQRPGNHVQRALELIQHVYRLRRQGCRKVFIRISASAAFELGVLSRLLNLQIYYWISGQGENLKPSWRGSYRQRVLFELSLMLKKINAKMAFRFVTGPETMVPYFKNVLHINENKIILLYNDIDIPSTESPYDIREKELYKSQLKISKGSDVILFVGRVSPLKGGHNLIPLAEKLLIHRHNAKLLVVGQLHHLPYVPKRAQELGLANVTFCGPIANRELSRYFLAADVFILPSESEGFPRVLLEAMRYGLPVVAFDVGGVRDILHPGQLPFLLPRGDIEGMVHKVTRLLADPALRSQQAELGQGRVRQYSTEAVARMFIERIVLD